MRAKNKLPLVHALAWIVGSTLLISGAGFSFLKWHLYSQKEKEKLNSYKIQSIIQTGPHKEALKSVYLAELLDLSVDLPSYTPSFDPLLAEKRLLASPVIKEVSAKVLNPTSIYIDYTVRQPVALLYDYENTAIDKEGYLFPLIPFFSPKNLPEIYLGMDAAARPKQLQGKQIDLAFTLLSLFFTPEIQGLFHVRWIDLSSVFADSCGKREIILILEDEILKKEKEKEVSFLFPRMLRLSTKNYAKELGDYLKLREQMLIKDSEGLTISQETPATVKKELKIIDLRLPQLAFIEG